MAHYTPKQRKQIAAEYRSALEGLPGRIDSERWDFSDSPYICDHITGVLTRRAGTQLSAAKFAAVGIISERIGHRFSLESWLKSQSEEIREQVRNDVRNNMGRKLQAYRMAWLKQLIKEFEGK
jgi:hypothetical protein